MLNLISECRDVNPPYKRTGSFCNRYATLLLLDRPGWYSLTLGASLHFKAAEQNAERCDFLIQVSPLRHPIFSGRPLWQIERLLR